MPRAGVSRSWCGAAFLGESGLGLRRRASALAARVAGANGRGCLVQQTVRGLKASTFWATRMVQRDFLCDSSNLRSTCREGETASGESLRLVAPPLLAEASAGTQGSAARLRSSVAPKVLADIEIDVPRCGAASKKVRAAVRRVLLAFASRNQATGYCQGLNVVTASILLALSSIPTADDEALAFWLVVVLTEERCTGWWEATFESLRRDVYECCGRAREQAHGAEGSPRTRCFFGGGNVFGVSEETGTLNSGTSSAEIDLRPIGLAVERLVDELGTPLDLVMTQWLLTVFAHAGAGLAPLGLRLRALDVALCAPNPHGAFVGSRRGPGSTALLALALATIVSSRSDQVDDVVQAARALEHEICHGDREALFLTAHVRRSLILT